MEVLLRLLSVILCVFISSHLAAETSRIEPLSTLDSGREWSAVGRLTINGGDGFCTASMITSTLLVTAAHCLFSPETNKKLDISLLEFQAGFKNGRAEAYRKIRRASPHPGYQFQSKVTAERVTTDLAVLELEHPIQSARIPPFQIADVPIQGQAVSVVSYARGRSEVPSYQEICDISEHQQGILIMTCDVDFGASGSPVFDFSNGYPRIVSVVSAMANFKGEKVSLGAELSPLLTAFEEEYSLDIEPYTGVVSQNMPSNARRNIGAKFSKP